jgi:hypothetical protein
MGWALSKALAITTRYTIMSFGVTLGAGIYSVLERPKRQMLSAPQIQMSKCLSYGGALLWVHSEEVLDEANALRRDMLLL